MARLSPNWSLPITTQLAPLPGYEGADEKDRDRDQGQTSKTDPNLETARGIEIQPNAGPEEGTHL